MPNLTPMPDGSVQITDDTGTTYNVPQYIAERDYPEEMAQHFQPMQEQAAPFVPEQNIQPLEAPPWEAVQGPYEEFAPEEGMQIETAPEMDFTHEQAGEQFAPMMPEPAPSGSASQSTAVSGSQSGTRPYQSVRAGAVPGAIDYSPLDEGSAAALAQRQSGIAGLAGATAEYDAGIEQRYADMAAQREQTMREHAQMREEADAQVQSEEMAIEQRRNNMMRMDMNEVWKDTSSKAKLVGVLSAGIAGWLNPTGENSVVSQMMKLADQSAREQAANMQLEQSQMAGMERALGRMENRDIQERKAYLEERAMLEANIVDQISLEKSKYQSQVTIAKLVEAEAAAMDQYLKTRQERASLSWNQSMESAKVRIQQEQFRANQARQASQFRQSMRFKQAQAAAAAAAKAQGKESRGRALFVRDDGKVVYANPEMEIGNEAWKGFDADLKVSRSLASSAKKIMGLVSQHGRVWSKLEADEQAAVKQQLGNIIEQMRPKVGANLTQIEKKNLEEQFGDPLGIIKNPEVTEMLLNRAIDNINERIDLNLSTWGSRTYDDAEIEGLGQVSIPKRYKRGELKSYFGEEFEGLNMSEAMEATATDSLTEIEGLQNQLDEDASLGEAGRRDLQRKIASSAAGLLDYALDQKLNDEQNKALYGVIRERVSGIDEGMFRDEMIRRDLTPLPPGVDPVQAFEMASRVELEGQSVVGVIAKEIERYGPLGARSRANMGLGPVSKDDWDKAGGDQLVEEATPDMSPGAGRRKLGW